LRIAHPATPSSSCHWFLLHLTHNYSSRYPDRIVRIRYSTMNSQVLRDEDRIIAGLDYSSFELLPGTVNPRPGMRYIEDSSVSAQFF